MRDVLTKLSEEPGISLGVLTAGELYEKSAELSHHDPFDRILILHISVSHI
jgi:PIN domain nuclease of toxin-antitoxin system